MNKIELLTKAINERLQIEYDYVKDWVSEWLRVWNPHVLYVFKAKDWKETTKCDIFQLSWWTESGELVTFKMCDLDKIQDIKILDSHFEEETTKYNPESDRYLYSIAKV